MLELKVLVGKLGSVDGLAARAVARREIAALDHKLLDDSVETRALVVQRLAARAQALLTRAQAAEVLSRLRHYVVVQLYNDAAGRDVADLDVQVDTAACRLLLLGSHCGLVNVMSVVSVVVVLGAKIPSEG